MFAKILSDYHVVARLKDLVSLGVAKPGPLALQSTLVDVGSAEEASENRGKFSFILEHWLAEVAPYLFADI